MNKTDELKPCPFCGGSAIAHYSEDFKEWTIRCMTYDCLCCFGYDKNKAFIIEKWNERYDPA